MTEPRENVGEYESLGSDTVQWVSSETFRCRICLLIVPLSTLKEHSEDCHSAARKFLRRQKLLHSLTVLEGKADRILEQHTKREAKQLSHLAVTTAMKGLLHTVLTGVGTPQDHLKKLALLMKANSALPPDEVWINMLCMEANATIRKHAELSLDLLARSEQDMGEILDERSIRSQFSIIKKISSGAFGRVFLAEQGSTRRLFAVKVLERVNLTMKNQLDSVLAERDIMAVANNAHIVNLYYAFQTKHFLYLVMDYLPGGDLASLLSSFGAFDESQTRAYLAEVLLALEHIHAKGFIHRDLKPENILIDNKGHIKLTDFGLSRTGIADCKSQIDIYATIQVKNVGRASPPPKAKNKYSRDKPLVPTGSPLEGVYFRKGEAPSVPRTTMSVMVVADQRLSTMITCLMLKELSHVPIAQEWYPDDLPDDPGKWTEEVVALKNRMSECTVVLAAIPDKAMRCLMALASDSTCVLELRPIQGQGSTDREDSMFAAGVVYLSVCPDELQDQLDEALFSFFLGWEEVNSPCPESPWSTRWRKLTQGAQGEKFARRRQSRTSVAAIVGTPDYMAVEVVNGEPHNQTVDFWSLGVIAYECLLGIPPYNAASVEAIFANIRSGTFYLPIVPEDCSNEAFHLILQLLNPDPTARLGANGVKELQNHPFFNTVDWDSLLSAPGPFVPVKGIDYSRDAAVDLHDVDKQMAEELQSRSSHLDMSGSERCGVFSCININVLKAENDSFLDSLSESDVSQHPSMLADAMAEDGESSPRWKHILPRGQVVNSCS